VEWTKYTQTFDLASDADVASFRTYSDITTGTQLVYWAFPQLESGIADSSYRPNGATAGGIIASWENKNGSGNNVTQGTQAKMPLVLADALDGYAGALWDGVDDTMVLDSTVAHAGATEHWAVLKSTDLTSIQILISGDNTPIYPMSFDATTGYSRFRTSDGSSVLDATGITVDTPILVRVKRDASSNLTVEYNGVDVTDGTPSNSGVMNLDTIGSRSSGSLVFSGILSEIVSVDGALSALNKSFLLGYFASKYPSLGI
jgi:hypothetical protein